MYDAAPSPCYTTSFWNIIYYHDLESCVTRGGEGAASYKKKLKSLYILTKYIDNWYLLYRYSPDTQNFDVFFTSWMKSWTVDQNTREGSPPYRYTSLTGCHYGCWYISFNRFILPTFVDSLRFKIQNNMWINLFVHRADA